MKALATSEKYGLARYVAYQGYYSLIGRDYECGQISAGGIERARSQRAG
jgi:hypothetical protein